MRSCGKHAPHHRVALHGASASPVLTRLGEVFCSSPDGHRLCTPHQALGRDSRTHTGLSKKESVVPVGGTCKPGVWRKSPPGDARGQSRQMKIVPTAHRGRGTQCGMVSTCHSPSAPSSVDLTVRTGKRERTLVLFEGCGSFDTTPLF